MRKNLLKTLFAAFLMLCGVAVNAQTFTVNNILYRIVDASEKTVEVPRSSEYTGDIVIPDNVDYDGVTYAVTAIAANAFNGYKNLTSVVIGNNVTTIGIEAFKGCTGLTSVVIGDGVTTIANGAFSNCKSLTSIEIPNSVEYIGDYFVQGCTNLAKVTIGSNVKSSRIGSNAFADCPALTRVISYIPAEKITAVSYSNTFFYNSNQAACTLYVPLGAKSAYASKSGWSGFGNIVEIKSSELKFDQYYKIKNVSTDLYLHIAGNNTNMNISNALSLFQLEDAGDGKFYITSTNSDGKYYAHAEYWNFKATKDGNKTAYTIELVDREEGIYSLYQEATGYNGYAGTDNTSDGSAVYCNKTVDQNGKWVFEAVEISIPEVGKYYKIKGSHSTNPWLTAVVEGGGIDVAANEVNAGIFQVTENGLRELFTGKYIGTIGSQITLVDDANTTTIEVSGDGRYVIKNGGRYLYNNQADYTREAANLTAVANNPDAPKWNFIEVTPLFTINNDFNGRGTLCYGNWTNGQEYLALADITLSNCANKSVTVTNDANKYWYITRTDDGLYIYNIGKGYFMQHRSAMKVSCSAVKTNGFTTEIRSKNDIYYRSIKSGDNYLTFSCGYDPNNNVGQVRWIDNNEEAATLLTITEVANAATDYATEIATINAIINGFSVTVTDAGWATLYLGYPAEIPALSGEEAGVYIITGKKNDNWLELVKVEEGRTLPANTGVLVKADAGTYDFVYSSDAAENVEGNLLEGTLTDEIITKENGSYYVLWNDEVEGVGFRNTMHNGDGSIFVNKANKAYLHLPEASNVSFYGFYISNEEDGTTAIEAVVENAETVIFDLAGRKVSEITAPGIYIVNGKKVIK